MKNKTIKVLSHYVMMQKHEVPIQKLIDLKKREGDNLKDYNLSERIEMILEEEDLVDEDSRDYEVVSFEII